MNRATADNQSDQSEEEGLEPTKEWVKDLVDEIIAEEFASPDLELHWLDEDDGDPETVLADRVKLGALTLNEMRAHLGLDPYANPAADRPMTLTPTGYVPIETNAGGEGANDRENVQSTKADAQSAQASIRKANPEDPKHPGWPAGTPGGKGGQFRPKDGSVGAFWVTRNAKIDQTSFVLLALLTQTVDRVGPRDALSPSQYGTKIHTEFAAAVRAEGLPGVEVEQTFSPDPDAPYGAKGSIRTDVILRDDTGAIIAIYDVKTGGAQLEPWRILQLRARTGTTSDTYVFEIHPDRGVLLKYRCGSPRLASDHATEKLYVDGDLCSLGRAVGLGIRMAEGN